MRALLVIPTLCLLGTVPTVSALETQAAVLQMLADVTLIDRECAGSGVNFGIAFRHAEANGVPMLDIMPLGRSRAPFEKLLQARMQAMHRSELCGSLSEHYAHLLPGLFAKR